MEISELDKARSIEAAEAVRTTALADLEKQLTGWNITLPRTAPLVLDFGLGRFASCGLTEIWIANELQAGYCGKYLFVAGKQSCPIHYHRRKHETFLVAKGRVRFSFEGDDIELREGDTMAVPELTRHGFTGLGPALLLELSQPCLLEDNFFENTAIPIGGNYRS